MNCVAFDIPLNKPFVTGKEQQYISNAVKKHCLSSDGYYTDLCQHWLTAHVGCKQAFLTPSCTAALEMMAILGDVRAGDEIIMPSYTFVSTANAFVMRGGIPVFVDIREDSLNIDEAKIEEAITPKTKAIVPVHYAGVSCQMDCINQLAEQYNLFVFEDAAHSPLAFYKNNPLGSFGHASAFSFHETKILSCGEGGALCLNDSRLAERAEIIRQKGTNRMKFFRNEVDKYTWVDIGSSYVPSEMTAAWLWAQLETAGEIIHQRSLIWHKYHDSLSVLENSGILRRPAVPNDCRHNFSIYYVLLKDARSRSEFIKQLQQQGVSATFHYVPLHSSPAGKKFGKTPQPLSVTDDISSRIVRLPLWVGIQDTEVEYVIEKVFEAAKRFK